MANILKKVLHNTSSKSPQDMVLRAAQTADKLTDTATERQQEELARYLSQMKVLCILVSCMSALAKLSRDCRWTRISAGLAWQRLLSVYGTVEMPY